MISLVSDFSILMLVTEESVFDTVVKVYLVLVYGILLQYLM
jgi:hypothetical protein